MCGSPEYRQRALGTAVIPMWCRRTLQLRFTPTWTSQIQTHKSKLKTHNFRIKFKTRIVGTMNSCHGGGKSGTQAHSARTTESGPNEFLKYSTRIGLKKNLFNLKPEIRRVKTKVRLRT